MRRWVTMAAAALGLSCDAPPGQYHNNDLELVTAYTAKDMCSCVFVQGQTEEYCLAWTKADPAVARVRVDHRARSVSTSAAILWGATAVFEDAQHGCVLR